MDDTVSDVLHQFEGNIFHRGGDGILGVDGTDDDRPVEGPFPVPDAGGFEIRHYGEVLPYFSFQPVLREFFPQDGIAFPNGFQTVTGDGAGAAHAQSRTREGLTVYHVVRQA